MPTVRLMHYDPRWKQEFQQTRSSILQTCLGWVTAVEHVGSTAISGLIARPTIDVLAGVDPSSEDPSGAILESANLIEGLNFRRTPTTDWAGESVMLEKPRHGDPTHRVFLAKTDSPFWRNAIALRDHLRDNPDVAIRFEETKIARWKSGQGDEDRYCTDKAIFFTHLMDQIQH
ncbi:GrpB family protein [Planctomycetes bacterium K23_9]|uniref:Dephospho-CoA kinase/protein folding accessory domain-containing protein n=1 Tax=Stieleria marina TaxID=1930275 RepID=A0A517P2T8_9BACT|nr:dephospho-CoA kinase/protein folding accessory domain-containing protein [Planctomycetes bacterium K23_9]